MYGQIINGDCRRCSDDPALAVFAFDVLIQLGHVRAFHVRAVPVSAFRDQTRKRTGIMPRHSKHECSERRGASSIAGTACGTAVKRLPANDAKKHEWISIKGGCSPLLRMEMYFPWTPKNHKSNIRDDSRHSRAAFFWPTGCDRCRVTRRDTPSPTARQANRQRLAVLCRVSAIINCQVDCLFVDRANV
jgi:hypothetical protein